MLWYVGVGAIVALVLQRIVAAILRRTTGSQQRFRSWRFWLILLGISAAITLIATSTISVAMISIIGIPIALFLMIAPLLFLVVLGTWLIRRLTGDDWMGTIAALVVTLMLLAVPPYFANSTLDQTVTAQVAGDHDDGTNPNANFIAVISDRFQGSSKDALNCDGFCQRALLNGVANRVIVLQQDLNLPIIPSVQADSFRLEKRASCAPAKLPQGTDPIEIAGERKGIKIKRADDLMQLEIAKGNCLIAEKVRLGSADIILSVGNVRKGASPLAAGLSLFADTVSADRISMHEKQGTEFVETYRKTFVVSYRLAPLYAPSAEGGAQLQMYPALARLHDTTNISEKYYHGPDWTGFLTTRLKMDLALRADAAGEETRTVLKNAILRTGEAQAMPTPVVEAFFGDIAARQKISGEDMEIARLVLEDERFAVSRDSWGAIRNAKDAPQSYFDAIAVSMFKRLRTYAASGAVKPASGWHEELSAIASVLAAMPRETILKHRADLDWLSRDDALRVQVKAVLQRYADFGADGVQPLLWLIDDAQRYRSDGGNAWQHPYLAGMLGLCKLGAEGSSAIQPLFDRLDSGVIGNGRNYDRLAVHTLVRMGADREELWRHARPKTPTSAENLAKERKDFDREVERAMKREECWY